MLIHIQSPSNKKIRTKWLKQTCGALRRYTINLKTMFSPTTFRPLIVNKLGHEKPDVHLYPPPLCIEYFRPRTHTQTNTTFLPSTVIDKYTIHTHTHTCTRYTYYIRSCTYRVWNCRTRVPILSIRYVHNEHKKDEPSEYGGCGDGGLSIA